MIVTCTDALASAFATESPAKPAPIIRHQVVTQPRCRQAGRAVLAPAITRTRRPTADDRSYPCCYPRLQYGIEKIDEFANSMRAPCASGRLRTLVPGSREVIRLRREERYNDHVLLRSHFREGRVLPQLLAQDLADVRFRLIEFRHLIIGEFARCRNRGWRRRRGPDRRAR